MRPWMCRSVVLPREGCAVTPATGRPGCRGFSPVRLGLCLRRGITLVTGGGLLPVARRDRTSLRGSACQVSVTDTTKGKTMSENNSNKVDYFTREGSLAVTPEVLPEIVKGLRAKVRGVVKGGENLVIAAAYATHAAIRVDENWSPTEWAKVTESSRAAVYIWKRMGVAVMDLGVERGTPEWSALVGKSAATKTPVSWVLDGLGPDGMGEEESRGTTASGNFKAGKANILPTREMLDDALSVLFERDENGVLIPSKPRAAADVKRDTNALRGITTESETGEGADPANAAETDVLPVGSMLAVSKRAAEHLATFLPEISDDAFVAEIEPLLKKVFAAAKAKRDAIKAAEAAA